MISPQFLPTGHGSVSGIVVVDPLTVLRVL